MTQVSGPTPLLESSNGVLTDKINNDMNSASTTDMSNLNSQKPANNSADDTNSDTGDGLDSERGTKHRFFCPQCNHGFTRSHNLKSHVLTHTHEKPFTCNQCSSQFGRMNDLKRHLRLHSGEKPFKCKFCRRSFARNDALIRHQKNSIICRDLAISGPIETETSSINTDDSSDSNNVNRQSMGPTLDTTMSVSSSAASSTAASSTSVIPSTTVPRSTALSSTAAPSTAVPSPAALPSTSLNGQNQDSDHLRHINKSPTSTKANARSAGHTLPPLVQTSDGSWRVAAESSTEARASSSPTIMPKPLNSSTNEELIQMNRMLEIRVRALEERLILTEERLNSLEHTRRST